VLKLLKIFNRKRTCGIIKTRIIFRLKTVGGNKMEKIKEFQPVVDLHMHVVPGVDDGARSIAESLEMLKLAEQQGVTEVFCTSHNGYSFEDGEAYQHSFSLLNQAASGVGIQIKLHKGCEVLCASEYMEDIIYGLDEGVFSTLANTKYVLAELYPDTKPSEALQIIKILQKHRYKPIIAHMERNYNITGMMVGVLIQSGALIQVNVGSFAEENSQFKKRACELLENQYIHFIGSDSHRLDHRPPEIESGVLYILKNTEQEYALKILNGNAKQLLTLS
jgi:protein-tyrosine phosphatase